jgi:lipopolysaccharide export system permease protein
MIRILDRMVVGTFLKLFGVVVLSAPALFVLTEITESLDDYIDQGLTGLEVARALAYQTPLYIQQSFPIAALVAAVFTVHGMTAHREIVAAKAGGVSFHRIIAPMVVAGLVLTGVALGLGEVVPRTNRIAAQILRSENPRRSWRSDFVYESEDGLTWQVSRLTATDGRMTDLVLERAASSEAPGLHVVAEGAFWTEEEGWTLTRGYLRSLEADSSESAMEFRQMRMPEIIERPEELLESPRDADEMTYAEMARMVEIIRRTGGNAQELLVRREEKITIPVATLIVLLFGAPLATTSKRGSNAFGIGVSLASVILFILLMRVAGALGSAGALHPTTAAWIPNAVFLSGALVLLFRVRT